MADASDAPKVLYSTTGSISFGPADGNAKVDTPSASYEFMRHEWNLSRSLMGGTRAMRRQGENFLPRFKNETIQQYESRLARSVLTNVYRRTVRSLVGKVFSKQVLFGADMPEEMLSWSEDINLQGDNITVFARRIFEDALVDSFCHVLVDFPVNFPGASLAEERERGLRPYFVHIPAAALFNARSIIENGKEILTHIRFYHTEIMPDGDWGERTVEKIKVFDRVRDDAGATVYWRDFVKDGDDWILESDGTLSIDFIPLYTLYIKRTGFMTGELPLEDLAYLNIMHWQSASDQRNGLMYSRFPMLSATGISQEEMDNIVVGPNKLLGAQNENAKFGYVEHTGAAFNTGRQELEDLKSEMDSMALEPMLPRKSGTITATARAMDEAQSNSTLAAWALTLQDFLEVCYQYAGRYVNIESGSVVMNTDYGIAIDQDQDVQTLLQMRSNGDLSRETFFKELKRREVISEEVDADEEAQKIEDEPAALGLGPLDAELPSGPTENVNIAR